MPMRCFNLFSILSLLVLIPSRLPAEVTGEQIQRSLQQGIEYLRTSAKTEDVKAKYLMAYTLAKTGSPHDHPLIVSAVSELKQELSKSSVQLPDHYYNAGVAALLLDTLGGEKYKPQLQALANYIIEGQRPHGGWFYQGQNEGSAVGDTSITQYALLGLWAAERNGVEIPKVVWSRAATWLAKYQSGSGAFGYHPNEKSQEFKIGRPSLAVAGTSSLFLCQRQMYPNGFEAEIRKRKEKEEEVDKKFKLYGGLLELVDVAKPEETAAETDEKDEVDEELISPEELKRHIDSGMRYLDSMPGMGLRDPVWRLYYIYGVERLGAFAEIQYIGNDDWYQTGAEALIKLQDKDGSWLGKDTRNISTCFAVLFLYRATGRTIKPPPPLVPGVGSGLLAGGRGLPKDLRTVQQKDGKIIAETVDTPVTDLLTLLESNAAAELRPIQEAVIETVRSDQREELIGQVDRLVNLLKSPDAEVRAIAVWSLARSNDISKAPLLIERIRKDPDYDVAREANRGLCVLSRRLDGVGYNADPTAKLRSELRDKYIGEALKKGKLEEAEGDLPKDWLNEADARKLEELARQWRASAAKAWQDWYLKVREYKERDDLLELEEE